MDQSETKGDLKVDNPIEYFRKICRVCLAPSENLVPIINVVFNHNHKEKEVSFSLNEVFNKYCDVIKDANLKPQNICEVCLDITSKAFSAFELFNASNERLDNTISVIKQQNHSEIVSEYFDASDGNQEQLSDKELCDALGDFDDIGAITVDDGINAIGDDEDISATTGDDDEINETGYFDINEGLDKSTLSKSHKKIFEATKRNILSKIQREAQIFRCNLCGSGLFKGIKVVFKHIEDKHPLETQCILCTQRFPTALGVLDHVNAVHSNKDKKLNLCKKCDKFFENQEALGEHMESEEHKNYNFQCICHFCKKTFNRGILLKRHILEVHFKEYNKKEKCSKCGVFLKYNGNLSSHVCADEKLENTEITSLLCPQCGHGFPFEPVFKLHDKKEHIIPFKCDYCSETFQRATSLFKHRVSHPECTNIVCPLCSEVSENLAEYKTHRAKNHNKHVCHICNKDFHKQSTLTQHLGSHSLEQSFKCHLCPQKFKYKNTLTLHINEHINRPSYACSYCDKTFKRQRLLRMHKTVVHQNVKKFKCNKCDRAFTNNWTLNSHLRLHMGYKPFSCPFCSTTFVDTTNRHRHVKKYHPDRMDDFESYKQTYQSEEVRIVNSIPITSINRSSSGDEQDTNELENPEMMIEEEQITYEVEVDKESDVQENDSSDGD